MNELFTKWKALVATMNAKGIPIPMLRDPKTHKGSVSLTMTVVSFVFCLVAMVGKWSGRLGGINVSQALNLLMICAGLYFGRKLTKDPNDTVTVDAPSKDSSSN